MTKAENWKERRERLVKETNSELQNYSRLEGRINDLRLLIEVFDKAGEAQGLIDSREGKVNSLQQQLEAQKRELDELGARVSDKNAELRELDRVLGKKQEKLTELEQQIAAAESVIEKAARAQRVLSELQGA